MSLLACSLSYILEQEFSNEDFIVWKSVLMQASSDAAMVTNQLNEKTIAVQLLQLHISSPAGTGRQDMLFSGGGPCWAKVCFQT